MTEIGERIPDLGFDFHLHTSRYDITLLIQLILITYYIVCVHIVCHKKIRDEGNLVMGKKIINVHGFDFFGFHGDKGCIVLHIEYAYAYYIL